MPTYNGRLCSDFRTPRQRRLQPAFIGSGAQAEYGNMQVPSVWRTHRTAATARVDALSSGGMDELEIPAFLRKQAD